MVLFVKNMVSLPCKLQVKEELRKMGLHELNVQLGMIEIREHLSADQLKELDTRFRLMGLGIIEDRKSIIIEKIKSVIYEMIHFSEELPTINFSEYISERLDYDYTYLSNIFSEIKGMTIQQFIILNKIERVKTLLLFDQLNLTEISYKLNYSSVAHLSNQFKKVTGYAPSSYKKKHELQSQYLENL